jgi:hypothetical protein
MPEMGSARGDKVFSATLGARERLLTYAVGYGVGIGVPVVLSVGFYLGFAQPWILLIPLPFLLAFGAPWLFRPTGYALTSGEIIIMRLLLPRRIPLDTVREIVSPASEPPGLSIGLFRVEGIHGTFGSYWNKAWGRYRVYVTDERNQVEIRSHSGSRVILSPDDPAAFVSAVRLAGAADGLTIDVGPQPS